MKSIRWLRAARVALFGSPTCRHKWKHVETLNVYNYNYGIRDELPTFKEYVLQCERCGDVMKRKV